MKGTIVGLPRSDVDGSSDAAADLEFQPMPGASFRERRRRPVALAFIVYGALAVALFAGAWRSPTHVNVGGSGDPPLVMWFLRWTPYALSHGHLPFFTTHLNFPSGVNLMWNTSMVLPSLVLWPVTVAFGPVAAYNALITLNLILSAGFAFLVLRRFVHHDVAAFVGGLLYGFGPYMAAQSGEHANLTAAFIPPLLLAVLFETLVRQRWSARRGGIVLGLLAAAQLLITEEVLASAAVAAAAGTIVLAVQHRREVAAKVRHALASMGWAAAIFLAVTAWPLWAQFRGAQRLHGVIQPPNVFVSDLANFVVPTGYQRFAPSRIPRWTGNPLEWTAYLGVPLIVILVYVTVRYRSSALVRFASALALVLAILSLGPRLHIGGRVTSIPLPWALMQRLPLFNNLLPSRFMVYVDLMAGLLIAVLLSEAARVRRVRGLAAAAVAVAVVSVLPMTPFPTSRLALPSFFTTGAAQELPEGGVALVAPFQHLLPSEPMLWQAAAGMRYRMPQGYFIAPGPDGKPMYGARASKLTFSMLRIQGGHTVDVTDDLRADLLRDLADRHVGSVIVGPMAHRSDMVSFFSALLGQLPREVGGVYLWTNLEIR